MANFKLTRSLFVTAAAKTYGYFPFPLKRLLLKKYKKRLESVDMAQVTIEPLPISIGELNSGTNRVEAIDCKVSVVIPTKNAGHEFEHILSMIAQQKGVGSVEVIVVDSGSTDNTLSAAKAHGAKIVKINPSEFNHGETRNLGASFATGDYLLFLTQDAVPVGDYWLYWMVRVIMSDSRVAATTCKSIPRPKADLFALWTTYFHNQYLRFNRDELRSLKAGAEANLDARRRVGQLEDTCACIKREVFDRFKFRRLAYAEDLDLGIRLAEAGHKIAFLNSISIIHSHNRPAAYFLKRSYVEGKKKFDLLKIDPPPVRKDLRIDETLGEMLCLYRAISAAMLRIGDSGVFNNPDSLLKAYEKSLQAILKGHISPICKGDASLDKLFEDIRLADIGQEKLTHDPVMLMAHLVQLQNFKEYISVHPELHGRKDEWVEAVYKFFAVSYGDYIGMCFYQGVDKGDKMWGVIDEKFSANI